MESIIPAPPRPQPQRSARFDIVRLAPSAFHPQLKRPALTVGVSNDLAIHDEVETDSSRSSGEDTTSAFSSPPASPSSGISSDSDQQGQRGHYRGITFEEILPPHLITNAPSPDVDQKQERRKSAAARRPASSTSTSTATVSSTKRGYPSVKNSGSKSRLRATARALVRHLSVAKRDSPRGYEVV
ncbi:hypothetical protein BC827DRAFT_1266597 [Russula dissimulans]|nr:hypothetical protein BC827DRAFT_1266597 [Russula dissimulans]